MEVTTQIYWGGGELHSIKIVYRAYAHCPLYSRNKILSMERKWKTKLDDVLVLCLKNIDFID